MAHKDYVTQGCLAIVAGIIIACVIVAGIYKAVGWAVS